MFNKKKATYMSSIALETLAKATPHNRPRLLVQFLEFYPSGISSFFSWDCFGLSVILSSP